MNNIIIMGVGRAGKTTLSKMIKEANPDFDVIHSDGIKWGIIRAQGNEPEFRQDIAKQMEWEKSGFLQDVLIEIFAHYIRNRYTPIILESGQLYLEHLLNHPAYEYIKPCTDIIVLGAGGKSCDERVSDCRIYDKKEDWTYGIPDQTLHDYCIDWEKQDLQRIQECEQYGIPYHNTSDDRTTILNNLCSKYRKD